MKYISLILNFILILIVFSECGENKSYYAKTTITKVEKDTVFVPEFSHTEANPTKVVVKVLDQRIYDSLYQAYQEDITYNRNIANYYKARFEALKETSGEGVLKLLPPYLVTAGTTVLSNGAIDWRIKSYGKVDSIRMKLRTWTTNSVQEDQKVDYGIGLSTGISLAGKSSLGVPVKVVFQKGGNLFQAGVTTELDVNGSYRIVGPVVEYGKLLRFKGRKK